MSGLLHCRGGEKSHFPDPLCTIPETIPEGLAKVDREPCMKKTHGNRPSHAARSGESAESLVPIEVD